MGCIKETKIYDFFYEKDKRENKDKFSKIIYEKDDLTELRDMFEKLINSDKFKTSIKNVPMDINSKEDKQLIKENKELRIKLGVKVPKVSIIYIIVSSMSISFFLMTFLLFILKGYLIIHPFISAISSIASIGLLITSVLSLYEFNDYLEKRDR